MGLFGGGIKRGEETVLRRIIKIFGILLVLLGIMSSLYPLISQLHFQCQADNVIARYDEWVKDKSEKPGKEQDSKEETQDNFLLEKLYQIMRAYNEKIYTQKQAELVDPFSYQQTDISLTTFGLPDEVVGHIEIPNIKVRLPIYLGANDDNMSKGAVHLTQTSYPIGGINTNSVIAAHRGYANAAMFRNIEQIVIGDRITVTNFREKLNYKVTDIAIIAPSEIDRVLIQEGKDMVTLITCHPYRQNYQRYVIYATREI